MRKYISDTVKDKRQATILAKRFKRNLDIPIDTTTDVSSMVAADLSTSLSTAVSLMRNEDLAAQVEGIRSLRHLLGAEPEAINIVSSSGTHANMSVYRYM
jgi:hypothetical protein